MDSNKLFQSKTFKIVLVAIGGLIVLLLVFKVGTLAGYRKASFSYQWGENYHRNFGGPKGGFFRDFISDRPDFIESHGAFGQIIKIDGSTLVVRGRDSVERIVLVGNKTSIMRFRDSVRPAELKIDDYIVVIGDPNEAGQIEAKLIRLLPSPPPPPR